MKFDTEFRCRGENAEITLSGDAV